MALVSETRSIPILFASFGRSRTATGLVTSLADPGGNATGIYRPTKGSSAHAGSSCSRKWPPP